MNIDLKRTAYWLGKIDIENQKRVLERIVSLEEEAHGEPITLFVTSSGGNLDSAIAFFDLIRLLKINLTTIGSGVVHSAAFTIWMSGIHRFLTPHTTALFHPPSRSINTSLNKRELEIDLILMQAEEELIKNIVSSVVSRAAAETVLRMRDQGMLLRPSEMITLGLAHGILSVTE